RDGDGELYVLVALGDLGPHQVGRVLAEHERARNAPPDTTPTIQVSRPSGPERDHSGAFTVQGVDNLLVQMARCCQPVPGDAIRGYLTRGRGVTVHRAGCATLQRLEARQPERVLQVEWGSARGGYEADVGVIAVDRKWLLKELTNVIAQASANVMSINSDHQPNGARVRIRLRLRVSDFGQLSTLLGRLSGLA